MGMRPENARWNFDEKPIIVFWETTKACLLACNHCRAEAIKRGLPGELTTKEGMNLIDQVMEFGEPRPVLIFTGGDLLMRDDIFTLIEYASKRGLRVAAAPSVTPLLTTDALSALKNGGVSAISISIDGADAATHDGVRGVSGTFDASLWTLKFAQEVGLRVQVNTTVMKSNYRQLADIFHLLRVLKIPVWEVFFLVRTGRGAELEDLEPWQYEDIMHFLCDASYYGVTIRTSEGPQFRRVVSQRLNDNANPAKGSLYQDLVSRLRMLEGPPSNELKAQTTGTRDGKGIIFVAHDGEIFPSGFLPISLGNVKETSLKQVYQHEKMLRDLRSSNSLKGKCSLCEYGDLCGGSRSRAYAFYGDPLQQDPACVYEPITHL